MNFLITGGCGFIGCNLVKELCKNNDNNIRIIDNLLIGTREDLNSVTEYREYDSKSFSDMPNGVELIVGDILDAALALKISKNIDVIIHLAANTGVPLSVYDPRTDCLVNVIGTFNFLEAARINNIPRFIFASSGAPAGEVVPPIHEELPPHPVSPYGASKLAGEGYCSAYNKTFSVDTVMLRFGNVYGPGSEHKSSVVAKFISNALNNEVLKIYGDGSQTRDFIYIDDLISSIISSIDIPDIGGETFQIASNMETTVGEMSELLINIMQSNGIEGIKLVRSDKRLGDVMRNFSDISKAKDKLKWEPQVALREGLNRTVKYFLNELNEQ